MKDLRIDFYKESWDFPLGCEDSSYITNITSIKRVVNLLKPFVGKKSNIKLDPNGKTHLFIKDFFRFCKEENIDASRVLEIEVVPTNEPSFKILVNYGKSEDVKLLTI